MAFYKNKQVAFVKASPTPTGTIEITENGIYDVSEYASADVNCAAGSNEDGSPLYPYGFEVVPTNVEFFSITG